MEKMNRRIFCGTSLMALPMMNVFAGEKGIVSFSGESDLVFNALMDEISRTTQDGVRNGFSAAHFRQYAGHIRMFDALLNSEGTGGRINRKLDDNDFYLLDQGSIVQFTAEYWKKRGIIINESSLADQVAIDEYSYGKIKKSIKKLGGIQKLNKKIAEAFERKAEEYASAPYQSGLTIQDDAIRFPALRGQGCNANFKNVQYEAYEDIDILDPNLFVGLPLDCLCKAMIIEGAILSIACVASCAPCCVSAAIMVGFATIMTEMNYCDSKNC